MVPDLRCYYHPDVEATSQCDRCGDYLCGQCSAGHEGLELCLACVRDLTASDLGPEGLWACVLCLAGSGVVFSGFFFGVVAVFFARWFTPVRVALWPLCMAVLSGAALLFVSSFILSLRGQDADKPRAGGLRRAVQLFSLGATVALGPIIALACSRQPLSGPMLSEQLGGATALAFAAIATVMWARSFRQRAKPRWALAGMFIPLLGADVAGVASVAYYFLWKLSQ